jgi:hypothetical protein
LERCGEMSTAEAAWLQRRVLRLVGSAFAQAGEGAR